MTLKVGFVGAGHIAGIHAKWAKAQPSASLVGVADGDLERARQFRDDWGFEVAYEDVSELLDNHQLDVVHVLVPPQAHAQVAVPCLRAGSHVLIEKPIADTWENAHQIATTALENGVTVCAGHRLLSHDPVRGAMDRVSQGEVGTVRSLEMRWAFDAGRIPAYVTEGAEYAHWAFSLSGGPLQDLIPHPLSVLLEYFDAEPRVRAVERYSGRLPAGFPDAVEVLLEGDGISAIAEVSLDRQPQQERLIIRGSEGEISVDLFANVFSLEKPSPLPRAVVRGLWAPRSSVHLMKSFTRNVFQVATRRVDLTDGIGPMIASYYQALEHNEPAPVNIDKALMMMKVIEAIWPEPCPGAKRVSERRTFGPSSSPRVLVTGATGFIGSHLTEHLVAAGESVRVLARPGSPNIGRVRRLPVEVLEGDISDERVLEQAVKGIDVIYHLAGATNNDWEDQKRSTIHGTELLTAAASSAGVSRLVYTSTLALCDIANATPGTIIDESVDYAEKLGPYAEGKKRAEEILFAAADKGLSVAILRPGIVVGPLGKLFFPHMGYKVGGKGFLVIGSGENPLPLTFVKNTVEALHLAGSSTAGSGEVFHIVDEHLTAREYVTFLREIGDSDFKIGSVPYPVIYSAAMAFEALHAIGVGDQPKTSRAQLKLKLADVQFSSQKAAATFGWAPSVGVREGLRQALQGSASVVDQPSSDVLAETTG